MGFIVVLILTTLAIAGSAAFFSIYGLAQIFSGAFLPVVIMSSSLEAGKLVAASFVYRYWNDISRAMRTYLIASIIVLMLITSAGIFGFLSQAHIATNAQLTETNSKVALLEEDKTRTEQLKQERLARRKQIDDQVANLPADYVRSRQRLINEFNEERKRIDKEVVQYDATIASDSKQISELKLTKIKEEAHVGPILFIAEAMGKDVNTAITWMIILIMFAFDPLAVVLTIGVNVALKLRSSSKAASGSDTSIEVDEPIELDEPTPAITSVEQLVKTPQESITIEQIRDALDQLNRDRELSPQELIQKQALEEMLRKKEVKQSVRNPQKPTMPESRLVK
jgi:hypothetical protein